MARRPIIEEPVSRLAAWSQRLALFAVVVAILSIAIVRSNLLELEPALATFGAALVFAILAVILAFAAFVVIWREGLRGLGHAVLGLFLALVLLADPTYLGFRALTLPAIDDITTDTVHPPQFEKLAPLRPPDRIAFPAARDAALQHEAYPDIQPLQENTSPRVTYEAALKLVKQRRWRVVDARPPAAGRDGTIEAVARTLIMRFHDDIVIRIAADGNGSRVDMRSASRVGKSDLGTNAARIRSLLDDLDDALGTASGETAPARKRPIAKPAPVTSQPAEQTSGQPAAQPNTSQPDSR